MGAVAQKAGGGAGHAACPGKQRSQSLGCIQQGWREAACASPGRSGI